MALPKRRKSKSKTRMRRSHDAIGTPNLRPCPRCGAYGMPHRVCPDCGSYKGEVIIEKTVKIKD